MTQPARLYSASVTLLREAADAPAPMTIPGTSRQEADTRYRLARALSKRRLVRLEAAMGYNLAGAHVPLKRFVITDAGRAALAAADVVAAVKASRPPVRTQAARLVGRTWGLAVVCGALQTLNPTGQLAALSQR